MTVFKRLAAVFVWSICVCVVGMGLFLAHPAVARSTPPPLATVGGITPTTIITRSDWFVHLENRFAEIRDIDCPTADFCKTVGTDGQGFTWNGSMWAYNFIFDSASLSCLSSTWCKISGEHMIWSWDGVDWTADELPAGYETYNFGQLECVNEQFCLVTGSRASNTYPWSESTTLQWDGSAWVDNSTPASYAMDCVLPTYCKGVSIIRTSQTYYTIYSWNGFTITVDMTPDPAPIYDIECLSEQFCKAVEARTIVLSWDGAEWQHELLTPTLPITDTLWAISCGSESSCKAVSRAGTIVSWDGSEWTVEDNFELFAGGAQVICPTVSNCYGVGQFGGDEGHGLIFGMYQQTLQDVEDGFVLDVAQNVEENEGIGCLTELTVTQVEENHPEAPAGMHPGRYWAVEAPCSTAMMGTLTLPSPITPTAETRICYQVAEGSLWQCRQDSFTAETITVNGYFGVSDWFIGVPNPSLTHTVYLPVLMTE